MEITIFFIKSQNIDFVGGIIYAGIVIDLSFRQTSHIFF